MGTMHAVQALRFRPPSMCSFLYPGACRTPARAFSTSIRRCAVRKPVTSNARQPPQKSISVEMKELNAQLPNDVGLFEGLPQCLADNVTSGLWMN